MKSAQIMLCLWKTTVSGLLEFTKFHENYWWRLLSKSILKSSVKKTIHHLSSLKMLHSLHLT